MRHAASSTTVVQNESAGANSGESQFAGKVDEYYRGWSLDAVIATLLVQLGPVENCGRHKEVNEDPTQVAGCRGWSAPSQVVIPDWAEQKEVVVVVSSRERHGPRGERQKTGTADARG